MDKFISFKHFYNRLLDSDRLHSAWKSVYSNAIQSQSSITVSTAKSYDLNKTENINKILSKLKNNSFKFSPEATPIKKKIKGKFRPVVSMDIDSRIVQRCILNILQSHIKMKPYLNVSTSFGGIKNKGVKSAIETIYKSIKEEHYSYYITTDIDSFFTKIRADDVIRTIKSFCSDDKFLTLLTKAIKLEVDNIDKIKKHHPDLLEKYNYDNEGVPQGSCLSPLFGNIYLYNFDIKMNSFENILCLRYLDDVILLGKNMQYLEKVFLSEAIPELKKLGLKAYKPNDGSGKSKQGKVSHGIEYLGIKISTNAITPSRESYRKFKHNIQQTCSDALNFKAKAPKKLDKVLQILSGKIRGWGNHYNFCNAEREMSNLDKIIDKEITNFIHKYLNKLLELKNEKKIRNKLGIFRLQECLHNPIIS